MKLSLSARAIVNCAFRFASDASASVSAIECPWTIREPSNDNEQLSRI